MNQLIKQLSAITLLLIGTTVFAGTMSSEVIKKETAEYILDIKFPQGFQSDAVNNSIKEFITNTQTSFMKELSLDADTPADAPGKTGLNITYSIPFESKNALSVQLNVSIYHRGAAHPSNQVEVLNFIQDKPVKLSDLFIKGSDYLPTIAKICSQTISAKKISDADWIKNGTEPTLDNYKTWSFSKKGVTILFNAYQVAAYVYGEQKVEIPLSSISTLIKPEISKVVWSN
ncbi:DUF3298 and DUF4163 domain-containing protein [Legionella waltersii]|nr:DUF3298 and DUF4163 domain-containing protein [Legionella waltersii]